MPNFLVSWIGATDLQAQKDCQTIGLGPIAQATMSSQYDEIFLISDYGKARTDEFRKWLRKKTSAPITLHNFNLSSPTNFGEIYQAVTAVVSAIITKFSNTANLTYHLSPGTPAMAAVWIILAKTRFPAELIESSREHGVRAVSIPFDISAEFIPNLLRKPDKELEKLAAGLPDEDPEFENIIHRSEIMQRIVLKTRKVAIHSIPVLIEGESGTGKELLARAIHHSSPRKENPFITINCGAIPTELIESELFGYEKGAFTGATSSRIGHFEAADTGTLFLDEIGELPKHMQVKLLRTLQEGEVKRLGATQTRKIDIRIIAATNRNLVDEVSSGTFREDLFYRLAVATIKLPPLRERAGDINLLIDKFLELTPATLGIEHKTISVSARNLLLKHSWPGNIRELQNTLARALVWSPGKIIDDSDIKESLLPSPTNYEQTDKVLNYSVSNGINLPEIIKKVAVHYLEQGLTETHGNKTKTAELLGLPSYQTLSNWLKKYGLE